MPLPEQVREVSAAIRQQPRNAALYARRARLYFKLDSGRAALRDAEQLLLLEGPKGANLVLKARALLKIGNVREAQKTTTQAESLGYADAELPLLQGELAFILRQYQPAITYLNSALKKSQFEERAYFYKGMVYAETGDTARAISSFQTAIEQQPGFADAIGQLAGIYAAKRDYKTAATYLTSGLRTAPDNGFLHLNLGSVVQRQGEPDSALKLFIRATQLDTTLYLAHYNAAVLHYDRGEYAAVVRHLRAVLRRTDKLPSTRLLLADAADRLGDARTAATEYGRLSKADPTDTRLTFRLYQAKVRLRQLQADSLAGRVSKPVRLDSLRKIR